MRAKPALAIVRGCRSCNAIRAGMLSLQSRVTLCRPCAHNVSAFLRRATSSFLTGLWIDQPSTGPKDRPEEDDERDASALIAEFKAGIENVIHAHDFKAHWDLAVAYQEMGLVADAISEFATSLDEGAPQDIAQDAFDILFGPLRARPGALDSVLFALGQTS